MGYVDYPQNPRIFPDYGPGKCKFCGKELTGRQRKWCRPSHGQKHWNQTRKYIRVFWKEYRQYILIRDKYTCQEGGQECHGPFEVHHIVPICEGGAEFDDDNVTTLCYNHHLKRHGKCSK